MTKKIILLFLNSLCFSSIVSSTFDFSSAGSPMGLMPGGSAGEPLFEMPTPEQMAEIEDFLSKLSPEELDELAKLGEQIIKEAEAEGRPLFPNMPIPQPPVAAAPRAPEAILPVQDPTPATSQTTEKKIHKEKMEQSAKQNVIQLIEVIAVLRQKTETDERYLLHLHRITPSLDILVYYLHVMRDSKYIVHLADEEFLPLKNEIISLKNDLSSMVKTLIIPHAVIDKKLSKYEREERRNAIIIAERTIYDCATRIEHSLVEKNLVQECEKLLKKYEPEAVKVKEEQARRAKLALEQSTRPQITQNKPVPVPVYSMKTAQYAPPARGSSTGTTIPSSYNNERGQPHDFGPSSSGRKSTGKGAGQKVAEGTKPEGSDKPASASDAEKASSNMNKRFLDLRKNIKKLDTTIRNKQEIIKGFFENKSLDEAGMKAARNAFEEIENDIYDTHEVYKKWVSDVGSFSEKGGGGHREKRKALSNYKRIMENEAQTVDAFHEYLDALEGRSDISDEKLERFDNSITEVKKTYKKLTKEIQDDEAPSEQRKKRKSLQKNDTQSAPKITKSVGEEAQLSLLDEQIETTDHSPAQTTNTEITSGI